MEDLPVSLVLAPVGELGVSLSSFSMSSLDAIEELSNLDELFHDRRTVGRGDRSDRRESTERGRSRVRELT